MAEPAPGGAASAGASWSRPLRDDDAVMTRCMPRAAFAANGRGLRPQPVPDGFAGPSTPRSRAFTLTELLCVLAILGIVATIAATSWHRHLQHAWRAQARTAMIAAMLELQRHAMARASFADGRGQAPAGHWPQWVPAPPAAARYRVAAMPCTDAGLDRCVALHAAPQWPDPACGTLILRSDGAWLAQPPDAAAGPMPWPDGC